ncbi:MAG: uroporphyrinogen decarboxylase family protein, partial [Planctomycetota bacterium]|nr:uroporphyrinogen decarboxylase family protein [Planctomycetota bacterium]
RELIFPFYVELIDLIHGHGTPVILHTCGYTESILDLIAETGFDGLNPMEVKAGNDTVRFAEGYADRLVFIGGLDTRVLETHDRETIRSEVTAFINGIKERGGRLVFGSDHSLSTNIDYDDFLYALEVYREHMIY